MNFENILNPDFSKMMSPEFIASMLTMLLIIIFSVIVYFKQKKYKATDAPKGIVHIAEMLVDFGDRQVNDLMGCPKYFSNFAGYIIPLYLFIFIGFVIGMMGIPNFIVMGSQTDGYILNETKLFAALPNPFTNLAFTLSIGFLTVFLIEFTKVRAQRKNYWKQFIFAFPPLLPAITNLVPMISLGIRLFGNALAGSCIVTMIYTAFGQLMNGFGLIAAPVIMPFLHFYFDLFSGLIQGLVFVMITMMDIAQEAPEMEAEETIAKTVTLRASMPQQQ